MNEDYLKECKETFDLYDVDENGFLNIEQTKELTCAFGIMATDDEINDLAENGKVTYDSFLGFYSEKMKNPKDDNLEESFNKIVSKKTGKISAEKFKVMLMNFGKCFSEQEANEVLQEFEIDEEGNLNYQEFIKAMHSQ